MEGPPVDGVAQVEPSVGSLSAVPPGEVGVAVVAASAEGEVAAADADVPVASSGGVTLPPIAAPAAPPNAPSRLLSSRRIVALDAYEDCDLETAQPSPSSKILSPLAKAGYPASPTPTRSRRSRPGSERGDEYAGHRSAPPSSPFFPSSPSGAPCSPSSTSRPSSKNKVQEPATPPPQEKVITLSEKAKFQEKLVYVLPNREFCFDDDGQVVGEFVERKPAAASFAEYCNAPECAEAYKLYQQQRIDTALLRSDIHEKAVLMAVHPNTQAWGFVEPPPTPCMDSRARANRKARAKEAEDGNAQSGALLGNAEESFRDMCCDIGLPASKLACKALTSLQAGAHALPQEFAGRAYLGNRCAQVWFTALVNALEANEGGGGGGAAMLRELKNLDLSGQGIGNEAALAFADLMPRCPQLCDLNLSRNNISDKGAHRLLKEVSSHPALLYVNLDGNPMPSWIRVHVKEDMRKRHEFEQKRQERMKALA